MNTTSDILLDRLDAFIRKFYTNRLIKGSFLFFSAVFAAFLLYVFTDWLTRMGTGGRTVFFFLFTGFLIFTLVQWIIIPIMKINRMGQRISYEEAAKLIGKHFSHVDDKIINTLQLKREAGLHPSAALVLAGIEQKSNALKPIPFLDAIDLSENRKYLRFLVPPITVLLLLLLFAPSFMKNTTNRFIYFNSDFKAAAPFDFYLKNKTLAIPEQEDITIDLELKGESIPHEVFIHNGEVKYRMEKTGKNRFTYVFDNVRQETDFYFEAGGFDSRQYELTLLPRPGLADLEMLLHYPAYLRKTDQRVGKTGDLTVPEGTQVSWSVKARNTQQLQVFFSDSAYVLSPLVTGNYAFTKQLRESGSYALVASNKQVNIHDSLGFYMRVIPDKYPEIAVEVQTDSASLRTHYFMGQARDDYGFSGLYFCYRYIPDSLDKGASAEFKKESINLKYDATDARFVHYWDMQNLPLQPGDRVEYYFIVYDNDGVNGAKSAKTQLREYRVPTRGELDNQTSEANKDIKKEMSEALKDVNKLNKEFDKLQQSLNEKKNLNWQDRNKAENLLQRQIELQQRLEDIKSKNEMNNQRKDEFVEQDPEMLEKQEMLEELMDKVLDEEMRKMIEELQKMLDKMDKNTLDKQLDEMKMSNEDMKKELDRSLELFKQLEFEQKAEDISERLDELAEKQEKLANETEKKEKSNSELQTEQQDINKEFEEVKKDLEELKELNEELEKKHDLENLGLEESEKEASEEMEQSKESISKNQNSKASKSQKNAAKKMNEMSDKLSGMMESAEQQQNEENMEDLRQLLENIVSLSMDQEDVMKRFTATAPRDPKYVKLGQEQRKLKDDAKMIEDSLFALSKRVVQIQPIVNQEIGNVNRELAEALNNIGERQTSMANKHQQSVMKSLNELALLLDEALQQMQQQAQSSGQGESSCNKPGKGKGKKPGKKPGDQSGEGVQSIKKMQEQLSKQLEQLKKGMEEGGKNPGNKGKMGLMPGMSKELAQAAARQAAIRQKLQEMSQMLNKDGSGAGNQLRKIAEEMEKNEEDLVNKRVNIETIRRQQDILTRLLESERAEREREFDEKRESKENKKEDFGNQKQFLEYKRKKEKEVELLKTLPPALTPYYKKKVNEYFNTVE